MPLPHIVARANKRFTNRFIEPVARRTPGFAIVEHCGRVSGRHYRTPIYAFGAVDAVVVSLTYGLSADWVRNVLTSGGTVERRGGSVIITDPSIVGREQAWPHLPLIARFWLRILRVSDFMLIPTP